MAGDTADQGACDDALVRLLTCVDGASLLAGAADAALPAGVPRVAALYRRHPHGRLTLEESLGLSGPVRAEHATLRAEADLPMARAARDGEVVYSPALGSPQATPDAAPPTPDGTTAYASLPLTADGERLGALVLLLPPRYTESAGNLARLRTVATVCAHRWQHLLAAAGGGAPGHADSTGRQHAFPEREVSLTSRTTTGGRAPVLDLAMANAGIGTFTWDFATGRVMWDERTCELFGLSPTDFDGRVETFFSALHPEDRPHVEKAVEESRRTGHYDVVYRVVLPDGSLRWLNAESRIVRGDGAEPQGMIGVVQDRTEEMQRRAARQARSDFVLHLTSGLTAAVTTDDVVDTLVQQAMPALGARWLLVYLRQPHGPMRLIGSAGFDRAGLERAEQAAGRAHGDPLLAAVRAGEPWFLESRAQWASRMPGEDLTPPPGQHAWALLPMTSADGLVGVCSLIYDRPRVFTADDRTVLTAAAGLLGQSMARARLQDTRRRYLTELQRLMLPVRLPEVPDLQVAACYRPGSEGLDVGGDWYDVVPRSQGRVALIIGDVQGHSVQAAGVMGQLRTAMRAYAAEGHGPADLLARGSQALAELDTELFATCCIAEIDPGSGRVRIARAGHPYPLLLDAEGRVRELAAPGGMPMGLFGDEHYPVQETVLEDGSALLLYTDGLVEQPGADYTDGVDALCERLAWWATASTPPPGRGPGADTGAPPVRETAAGERGGDLDDVVVRIAEPATSRPLHDDIAVLLVRRTSS